MGSVSASYNTEATTADPNPVGILAPYSTIGSVVFGTKVLYQWLNGIKNEEKTCKIFTGSTAVNIAAGAALGANGLLNFLPAGLAVWQQAAAGALITGSITFGGTLLCTGLLMTCLRIQKCFQDAHGE